jgi:uncharacterized RDD family membrane protein YckC
MYSEPLSHLPDPDMQAAFYEGVTVKRGIAWVLDTFVIAAITLPLALFSIVGLFFIPVIFLIVGTLYRWMTIANGSATWGMRFMAIELRDAYGQRLSSGLALAHTLGYTITASTGILQLISIALMLFSPRGQGLSDLVLGTVALNQRA